MATAIKKKIDSKDAVRRVLAGEHPAEGGAKEKKAEAAEQKPEVKSKDDKGKSAPREGSATPREKPAKPEQPKNTPSDSTSSLASTQPTGSEKASKRDRAK